MVDLAAARRAAEWQFLANSVDITFVGSLVPRKGARQLLEAFVLLREKHPQATLAIAGDGHEGQSSPREADAVT